MDILITTAQVVTGVEIKLNKDELGNLCVALGDYIRLMREHGNIKGDISWEWIETFKKQLDGVK